MTWGSNGHGQLGHGDDVPAERPLLSLVDVIAADVGATMAAAVTSDGALFTAGNPEGGRLGRYTGEGTWPIYLFIIFLFMLFFFFFFFLWQTSYFSKKKKIKIKIKKNVYKKKNRFHKTHRR